MPEGSSPAARCAYRSFAGTSPPPPGGPAPGVRELLRSCSQRPSAGPFLVLALAAVWASAGDGEQVLFADGFERGLEPWQTEGAARFAVSTARPRSGKSCAEIDLAGAKPAYQKLFRFVDEAASPGDRYRARALVRTSGVREHPGAYVVLEFFEGERRVEVCHGGMATDSDARDWRELEVEGVAPPGARRVRVALVLHSSGKAWFDDVEVVCMRKLARPDSPPAPCRVLVDAARPVTDRFGGVGFHVFDHLHEKTARQMNEVFAKRWRELNPSFARLTHMWDWDWADAVSNMKRLRDETRTEIYLTTWDPKDTSPGEERIAYARRVAEMLERLVKREGLANVTTYCMTNELSLGGWGTLRGDLPKFRDYHAAISRELAARALDVQLLATDASPIGFWYTIEWAAENMDEITGAYGGHHYINDYHPADESFYPWFLEKVSWGTAIASKRGKPFIIGEFGSKQDGRTIGGQLMDRCIWWDTPEEPLVSLQVAEAALAAVNAGAYAICYWTFADFPDDPRGRYQNKWGLFKWSGADHSTRPLYYSYGLLTRFLRGPARVLACEASDRLIRAAALAEVPTGRARSLALVNRYDAEAEIAVEWSAGLGDAALRRYSWSAKAPPSHPFGDMPPHSGVVRARSGRFEDRLAPLSVTVYTTAFTDTPPPPVRGLKVEALGPAARRLSWTAPSGRDICYYRVYAGESAGFQPSQGLQIGSTVATEFVDDRPRAAGTQYLVLAVDSSGNAGPP